MSTRYVWGRYRRTTADIVAVDVTTSYISTGIPIHNANNGYVLEYSGGTPFSIGIEIYAVCDYDTGTTSPASDGNISVSGLISPMRNISVGESFTLAPNQAACFTFGRNYPIEDINNIQGCFVNTGNETITLTIGTRFNEQYVILTEFGATISLTRLYFTTETARGYSNGLVSGTSQSSYPSDGVQGSYWYTYQGSDSIDPTAVGYNKTTPKGGESITINVTPRSNTYGGTITYKYEVQLSGGTWTNIGSTTSTAKSYVIPKGTTTFAARVVASDNMGFTSTDYVTGNTCSVINNTAPNISGEDSDLGTFRYEYPIISYIITDSDEQTVIRKIELDSVIVATEEAIILGQEYTYTITEEQMIALADGVHTIKITATDSEGATAKRTYQFTKFFGSDTLYQRLRRLNDLGLYDTIYFENNASNIIRPNGMTVQETIDKIEADLAELEK